MYRMARTSPERRTSQLVAVGCCILLAWSLGCERRQINQPESGTGQTVPFHADSQAFEGDGATPALPPDTKMPNGKPFHTGSHALILPAGTLLTVQLQRPLSADRAHPGDTFSASVATPLAMDGSNIVDFGTPVTGRVESVRLDDADQFAPRAYFRLTLSSITLKGESVAIQTSSLFTPTVQPPKVSSRLAVTRIQKGRELTFRLTAPLDIDWLSRQDSEARPVTY